MRDRLLGVRLVDHGRQHHQPARAETRGGFGEATRLGRGVFGDSGQERRPASDMRDRRAKQLEFLMGFERTDFADRAEQHHSMHARIQQAIDLLQGSRQIERKIAMELRGDCRKHAAPGNTHFVSFCSCCVEVGSEARTCSAAARAANSLARCSRYTASNSGGQLNAPARAIECGEMLARWVTICRRIAPFVLTKHLFD